MPSNWCVRVCKYSCNSQIGFVILVMIAFVVCVRLMCECVNDNNWRAMLSRFDNLFSFDGSLHFSATSLQTHTHISHAHIQMQFITLHVRSLPVTQRASESNTKNECV